MTSPSAPSYREIPLTKGQTALVDESDFESLNAFKWYASWNSHTQSFYAARNSCRKGGKPNKPIWMHREILGLPRTGDGRFGDHVDHDTLDNRRRNLRVASGSENASNARLRKDNPSGFKGVTFHKPTGRWRARIQSNGVPVELGYTDTPEEASRLYCAAVPRFHGKFACPN